MTDKNVTREHLYEAIRRKVGLSAPECKALVEQVFDQITSCLVRGESVKLSGFGLFAVLQKKERLGRNPKTGEPAPISARRVVSFRASADLKQQLTPLKRFPERSLKTSA